MKHALLVWEELPNPNTYFLVPLPPYQGILLEAHGKFLEKDPANKSLRFLARAVQPAGSMGNYRVDITKPLEGVDISSVFISGVSPKFHQDFASRGPGPYGPVLLVWEELLECTSYFLIPAQEALRYRPYLAQAHGKYIHRDKYSDGLDFLSAVLSDPDLDSEGNQFHAELGGTWLPYRVGIAEPLLGVQISSVFVSGLLG